MICNPSRKSWCELRLAADKPKQILFLNINVASFWREHELPCMAETLQPFLIFWFSIFYFCFFYFLSSKKTNRSFNMIIFLHDPTNWLHDKFHFTFFSSEKAIFSYCQNFSFDFLRYIIFYERWCAFLFNSNCVFFISNLKTKP